MQSVIHTSGDGGIIRRDPLAASPRVNSCACRKMPHLSEVIASLTTGKRHDLS
ncbi:hypothetical protein C4J95_1804 [Pseudomonas orientalis]|nr:hypothetical protein C4J97_1758 [Pseudomonas orientalis]AZE93882.1 hypothetical protein C4J96_1750 [Pseudomonas orientalis]AZE99280.1 hypothetical protein C4J95_1804 [Pseudomonas orientalis]